METESDIETVERNYRRGYHEGAVEVIRFIFDSGAILRNGDDDRLVSFREDLKAWRAKQPIVRELPPGLGKA